MLSDGSEELRACLLGMDMKGTERPSRLEMNPGVLAHRPVFVPRRWGECYLVGRERASVRRVISSSFVCTSPLENGDSNMGLPLGGSERVAYSWSESDTRWGRI